MATASDLLALARSQLLTKEDPAGSNNVKYNTAYYGREVHDTATAKYPWCVVFIWWLFWMLKAAALFFGGQKTASCGTLLSYAKAHGLYVQSGYVPGDLIFLRFSTARTTPEHIGILKEIRANGDLVTIEGNTGLGDDANGGQVQQRVRKAWMVLGAYRPEYDKEVKYMDNTPKISSEAVAWAKANGILLGNKDGDLMLSSPCTREQMVVFLYRYHQAFRQ
ncbi:MAG: CHAP domain-containing protein [Elusimicrobiales bacterium]|nr:CHAP domain-containing protein [Elusimicrobiales bacterium]